MLVDLHGFVGFQFYGNMAHSLFRDSKIELHGVSSKALPE